MKSKVEEKERQQKDGSIAGLRSLSFPTGQNEVLADDEEPAPKSCEMIRGRITSPKRIANGGRKKTDVENYDKRTCFVPAPNVTAEDQAGPNHRGDDRTGERSYNA